MANIKVNHSGKIEVSSSHAEILQSFLQPLFDTQIKHYEERHENIERVAAAAQEAKLRKRRHAVDDS
jgi:predicted secreted Zn-dependent protease